MPRKEDWIYIGVNVPKEIHEFLVAEAIKQDKSISAILRTILNNYIESRKKSK